MLSGTQTRRRTVAAVLIIIAVLAALAVWAVTQLRDQDSPSVQTPMLQLAEGLPEGSAVVPIISSGDTIGDFTFEGLPDGIGLRPGRDGDSVDVFVAHEQSTVLSGNERDFQDASVSRLTLPASSGQQSPAAVSSAAVAIGPEGGFHRFCSASIAGPEEGLDDYVFFTGEETDHVVDGVQRGYAVVLNTNTGDYTAVPGMGRLNHENTMIVPGAWGDIVTLTTDDTFTAGTSQLYMYRAADQDAIFEDTGSMLAFRVTGVDGLPLADPADPFNAANDYLDLGIDESFQGEFIPVPREVAIGDQTALESWSNDNNVMQFVRLEDVAVDRADPLVVYLADTGASGIEPNPLDGRMHRPEGAEGMADNGRIFKLVLSPEDPTVVESLSVLADGDAPGTDVFVPFTSPDNLGISDMSLMVQEDTREAQIWQYRLDERSWHSVASVIDPDGESSGIVDASDFYGPGSWLLTVQAHGSFVDTDSVSSPGVTIKREAGQLLQMTIPGS